jgi:beta-lactamase superfamily II metal-dependent hydrolase
VLVCNVGQGNSVAVKNGNKAIIVDSGFHQSGSYYYLAEESPDTYPLLNFIKNCETTVFITHTHSDHFSLLSYLFGNRDTHGIKIGKVYCSDFAAPIAYTNVVEEWRNSQGIMVNSVNTAADVADIGNVLGDNIEISVVIPENWPRHGKKDRATRSKDPNDNSMAIVVTDTNEKKKLLFPGDATGATLDCVMRSEDNIEKLKDINCMIVPHHGSNLSGAFSWIHFVKDNIMHNKSEPLLAIVSSDPTECDLLPWFGISQFCYLRGDAPDGYLVEPHNVSIHDGIISDFNGSLFVTKDSEVGFFRILSNNEAIKLYDGKKLLFQSNAESISTLHGRISALLSQMNIEEVTQALREVLRTENDLAEISDEVLLELSAYSAIEEIRDVVTQVLNMKLAQSFDQISEATLITAMEYTKYEEVRDKLLALFVENQANITDGVLHKLSTYPNSEEEKFVKNVLNTRLQRNPTNRELTLAMRYPDIFREVILERLKSMSVTEEDVWLMAIHHGIITNGLCAHLLNEALNVSDGIISKLSNYENLNQLTIEILKAKFQEEIFSDVMLSAATKYSVFDEAIITMLKNLSFEVSDVVLLEAMKYPKFNDAIYGRLYSFSPLEEDDMSFYIRHLKELRNSELLHQIVELPMNVESQ